MQLYKLTMNNNHPEHTLESIFRKIVEDVIEEKLTRLQAQEPKDKMYTAKEAAEKLGISPYKLRHLREKGVLSYIKNGSTYTFPAQSIQNYVDEFLIKGKY